MGHEFDSSAARRRASCAPRAQLFMEVSADIEAAKDLDRAVEGYDYGGTRLHQAAEQGNLEAMGLLLQRGASPVKASSRGRTPLHSAARNGHPKVAMRLLEAGADPNAANSDEYGYTPLHYATMQGDPKVAAGLVEAGADVNAANNSGHTPLYLADRDGHAAVSTILRAEGGISK